jgi:AraC-like DNA-binding protein
MGSSKPSPFSTVLFSSELVKVGRFAVEVDHPRFRDAGIIGDWAELVFPTSAVVIEQEGARPFVADPACVVWYAPRRRFTRAPLAASGDRSHWFAFDSETLEAGAAAVAYDGGVGRLPREGRVLLASPRPFVARSVLLKQLEDSESPDPLQVEETALALLTLVLESGAPPGSWPEPSEAERRLAHEAQVVLASRFAEKLTLGSLSQALGYSLFHVARAFRRASGLSLHSYQTRLRLRSALDRLATARGDLTGLALDLGFSSHSHFSAAVKREYGLAPSRLASLLVRARPRRGE